MKKRVYTADIEWTKDDFPHSAGDKAKVETEASSIDDAVSRIKEENHDVVRVHNVRLKSRWYGS